MSSEVECPGPQYGQIRLRTLPQGAARSHPHEVVHGTTSVGLLSSWCEVFRFSFSNFFSLFFCFEMRTPPSSVTTEQIRHPSTQNGLDRCANMLSDKTSRATEGCSSYSTS
jgi:hypothetical protein